MPIRVGIANKEPTFSLARTHDFSNQGGNLPEQQMVHLGWTRIDLYEQPLGARQEGTAAMRKEGGWFSRSRCMAGFYMRCRGCSVATLAHEGNYNLVSKTSFRTMDTEPARLRKHLDNAHTVALADVFHERFHAQYIFEIYKELVVGFRQKHEARYLHSCA